MISTEDILSLSSCKSLNDVKELERAVVTNDVLCFAFLTPAWIFFSQEQSADKNIAVSLLPKLTLLDGADCQPFRKLEALGDKKLLPQISRVWESTFKDNLLPGASDEEVSSVKKDFLRHLRRTHFECNEFSVKFKKFKGSVKGAEACIFLRAHSQDPADSVTQVWQAAFQPKCEENDLSPNIFATCGGRIVNFIDASTGTVLKRYRSANMKEEFFCLAWTVLPIGGHPSAVLAVAGKAREVSLVHPVQLVCYKSFQAHTKYINCLHFCPSQPTWLLSGGNDDNIHLWDIGVPKAPGYQTKIVNLLTLKPKCEILQLCVSTRNEMLLAACHVSKCSNSGMIGMWELSTHVAPIRKFSQKLQKVKVEYRSTFLWSDTKVDYFYPSATADVMACGDDAGTVWLYSIGKKRATLAKPIAMLTWPDKLSCSDQVSVTKKDGKERQLPLQGLQLTAALICGRNKKEDMQGIRHSLKHKKMFRPRGSEKDTLGFRKWLERVQLAPILLL
ncbi:hypothetical protein HPB51_021285 [Rhipicephalus microplus]|uniref:Leucine-rich repeat and WD repeat-containing protein 1 WD domain-containing protein n=1 Tax=Rhipicephalus microplus TaxID=6941 RepID=A0A9J6F7H6_RHIMP|nr:hypothetical protein HPB51_021285 [Rhipicephalus microplus]